MTLPNKDEAAWFDNLLDASMRQVFPKLDKTAPIYKHVEATFLAGMLAGANHGAQCENQEAFDKLLRLIIAKLRDHGGQIVIQA